MIALDQFNTRSVKTRLVLISPAPWVIRQFGGVRATGRALGRASCVVSRWNIHTGMIPNKLQATVLQLAKVRGLDITAEDLIIGRLVSETVEEDEFGF